LKKILITRSKERSQDLNVFLIKNGYQTFNETLFDEFDLDFLVEDFSKIKIVLITSFYGAKAILKANISKNALIFAVGKFSCQELVKAGYQNIKYPQLASAKNLHDYILNEQFLDKKTSIYYFRGQEIAFDFKTKLEDLDYKINEIICYKINPKDKFSPELIGFTQQEKFDEVLLYSKNSALIFYKLVKNHNMLEYFKNSKILCISEELADFLRETAGDYFLKIASFDNSKLLKKFYE